MQVKVLVLRDEMREWRDRAGVVQRRRTVHCFPTEDDGARRELDIVIPLDSPPLQAYKPVVMSIEDWRAYQSDIVFTGKPLNGE